MPRKPGTCPVEGTCANGHTLRTTSGGPRRTTWRGPCPHPDCDQHLICRAIVGKQPKETPAAPPPKPDETPAPAPAAAGGKSKPVRKVAAYREPAQPSFEPPREPAVPGPAAGERPAGVPDPARGTGQPAGQQPAGSTFRERAARAREARRQRRALERESETIPGIY